MYLKKSKLNLIFLTNLIKKIIERNNIFIIFFSHDIYLINESSNNYYEILKNSENQRYILEINN